MRVAVVTQGDRFVIPRNVERIADLPGVDVRLIAVVDASGAVESKKSFFRQGFGLAQSARMGMRWSWAVLIDGADRATGCRLLENKRSLSSVACRRGIPFTRIVDPNHADFLARLELEQPDLVVSLSAPCIFRTELLALPRLGCINLHCSLLPRYAGLLPSFWVLYHGEQETGATVHYMDSKIDNGGILGQVRLPIERGMSVFDVIQRTKTAGGDLLLHVISGLRDGRSHSRPNDAEERSYFSWPTIDQMREFRRRGGRFV